MAYRKAPFTPGVIPGSEARIVFRSAFTPGLTMFVRGNMLDSIGDQRRTAVTRYMDENRRSYGESGMKPRFPPCKKLR